MLHVGRALPGSFIIVLLSAWHIVLSVGQAQGVLSGEWRMYWTLRKQGSPDQDGTLSLSWTLNHHILRAFQVTKPHLDGILSTTQ